jgi:multidrug efflux pump subunit AcrA (membrane-fusion protein)
MKHLWPPLIFCKIISIFLFIGIFSSTFAATEPAKVRTQVLKKIEDSNLLLFPARAYSRVETNLYAEYEGIVQTLPLNVGQKVSKNGTLMMIQNTDPVYQYAPVRIYSPVGGVVSAMEVKQGTHVTKGELLATVTDPSKLRVTIEIPAQDLPYIQAGKLGDFKSANSSNVAPVKVLGVSPLVDPKTGTSTADLEILKGNTIPAGMVGQVSIKTDVHQAILISEDALTYRDGKPMLRTLINGKMKLAPVELGMSRRGNVEIKSGAEEGQTVILRSSRFVSEGETVAIETGGT